MLHVSASVAFLLTLTVGPSPQHPEPHQVYWQTFDSIAACMLRGNVLGYITAGMLETEDVARDGFEHFVPDGAVSWHCGPINPLIYAEG